MSETEVLRADELLTRARDAVSKVRVLLGRDELAALGLLEPTDPAELENALGGAMTAYEELDLYLADPRGAWLPAAYQRARPFRMPEDCDAYGHVSKTHGGLNVEIDAPAGMKVTVHVNDDRVWRGVIPD